MALGAIVVLTTSTLNRVMVVELALPALLPGLLVGVHYAMQGLRPRMGFGSDVGGRSTPWIVGGMAVLATGGVGASGATALMASNTSMGIVAAVLSFAVIGIGVSACGTNLLVLLAKRVDPPRRAAAATIVWLMMIMGFAITAGVAGKLLDPYSPERLIAVTAAVAAMAVTVTLLALYRLEGAPMSATGSAGQDANSEPKPGFRQALREVWSEPAARQFTIFVFVSMLAYSAQDLVLEPFAGAVFGLTPGESTRLSGMMSSGTLIGMLIVAVICTAGAHTRAGALRAWTIGGCVASALMLLTLAVAGLVGPSWPLRPTVFALGLANGAFAVAAIGSMMGLVGRGRQSREGTRMGLWGAAQAMAFGLGGIAATATVDLARWLTGSVTLAYGLVFVLEAVLFVVATLFAVRLSREDTASQVEGSGPPVTPTVLAQAGRG
jgi:BCD family chlorophyll transporter-like MFS transporter